MYCFEFYSWIHRNFILFHWYHNVTHTRTHFPEIHMKTISTIFFSYSENYEKLHFTFFTKPNIIAASEMFHETNANNCLTFDHSFDSYQRNSSTINFWCFWIQIYQRIWTINELSENVFELRSRIAHNTTCTLNRLQLNVLQSSNEKRKQQ